MDQHRAMMYGRGDDAPEGRRCMGEQTMHRLAHNKAAACGQHLWVIGARQVDEGRAISGQWARDEWATRISSKKSSGAISSIFCTQSLKFVSEKSCVKSLCALSSIHCCQIFQF